jgi:hypothetical protein
LRACSRAFYPIVCPRHKSLIRPQSGIDQRPKFKGRVMSEESGGGWGHNTVAFAAKVTHARRPKGLIIHTLCIKDATCINLS